MRFWNYLYEKISRDEVKGALNNDNIVIGAEFEFIADLMAQEGTGSSEQARIDFEAAQEAYEDWMSDLRELERRREQTEDDISELEREIEWLEDQLEDAEDEADKENFQDQLDDMRSRLEDAQDTKNDLEMEDLRPSSELENYLDKYEGRSLDLGWPEDNEPTHPDRLDVGSLDDEGSWQSVAEDVIPEMVKQADFIDKYEIGGYGDVDQTKTEGLWAFEFDSSIAEDGGVEMKSPPMKLPDFIEILPKVFDFIGAQGGTNSKCGLHFHMSFPSASELDMAKLILFTEEEYIYLFFPERVNSNYAREVKSKVERASPDEIKDYFQKLLGQDISPGKAKKLVGQHHDAIRKIERDTDETHVEFRYLGGTDYHTKENDVEHLVGRYAHTLSLAVDPEYKYQEYIKKMTRLLNKIESAGYEMFQEVIDYFIKEHLDDLDQEDNISEETKRKIANYLETVKKKLEKRKKSLKVEVEKSIKEKVSSAKYHRKIYKAVQLITSSEEFPKIRELDKIMFEDEN